jgi:flagellar biosynthesis protein FliR
MPTRLTISTGTLYGFALTLARVSGALVFVPLPGIRAVAEPARAGLALAMTMSLASRWPAPAGPVAIGTLAAWMISEAALGVAMGIGMAIALEAFALAAQVFGLQAGYAYASTIDPNSEADSGVLLVFAQLIAGMMFFALGLDREVLRLFAQSLDVTVAGTYVPGPAAAAPVIHLGSALFAAGVRLALPVVALLLMVDVALALLGRLNQQLQLLSLAFPVKMLLALAVLTWTAAMFPRVLSELGGQALVAGRRAAGL